MGLFSIAGRYIAGKFLMTILVTFLLCAALIFMIDFVEVLRQSSKHGAVPFWRLIWMTLLRLPAYTEILLAFAVLVGTIGALMLLSRGSELTVLRAAGVSVWQLLAPGIVVAFALGVFAVLVYNPLAAAARAEAEREFADAFGKEGNLLRSQSGGAWLRQDGADGPSVLSAASSSDRGLTLTGVTVFHYDRQGRFLERIDGAKAQLRDGYWEITDAWLARVGREPERFERYVLSTYLTPERVSDALGSLISVSVFELPGLIEVAEKAGLSPARWRVQYELLLARPFLLVAMVLLGATVSLRSFRFGHIQTMVVAGMIGGFGFFLLAEVSRQIGSAGLVPASASAWLPVAVGIFLSLTVLLHQEDG